MAALVSGIVAGLAFGVSARIAMRLLALGMDAPLRLTASGTVAVIVIFWGLGIGLAFPYCAMFRRGSRGRPLVYALVVSAVTLQPFIRAAAQDLEASAWNVRVILASTLVTILLWFPYAALLELAFSRIAPWFHKWKVFGSPVGVCWRAG